MCHLFIIIITIFPFPNDWCLLLLKTYSSTFWHPPSPILWIYKHSLITISLLFPISTLLLFPVPFPISSFLVNFIVFNLFNGNPLHFLGILFVLLLVLGYLQRSSCIGLLFCWSIEKYLIIFIFNYQLISLIINYQYILFIINYYYYY